MRALRRPRSFVADLSTAAPWQVACVGRPRPPSSWNCSAHGIHLHSPPRHIPPALPCHCPVGVGDVAVFTPHPPFQVQDRTAPPGRSFPLAPWPPTAYRTGSVLAQLHQGPLPRGTKVLHHGSNHADCRSPAVPSGHTLHRRASEWKSGTRRWACDPTTQRRHKPLPLQLAPFLPTLLPSFLLGLGVCLFFCESSSLAHANLSKLR